MRLFPSRRAVFAGVAAVATAAALAFAVAAGATGTEPRWAPAAKATVHPGVTVTMAQVQCRVGFVLTDGTNAFVAVPSSCSGVSGGQPTDGCTEGQVPVGTTAKIEGARYAGHLVYSSFTQMAAHGVRNPDKCAMNGLSLIKLDRRDIARTSPSVPVVGGPTGIDSTPPSPGAALTLYLSAPAQAVAIQNGNSGWSHTVMPETAVTSLDIGAPVLDGQGRAIGMVAQVQQMPGTPALAGDLGREITYLHRIAGFGHVRLALGSPPSP
jgi:hypothetical protein